MLLTNFMFPEFNSLFFLINLSTVIEFFNPINTIIFISSISILLLPFIHFSNTEKLIRGVFTGVGIGLGKYGIDAILGNSNTSGDSRRNTGNNNGTSNTGGGTNNSGSSNNGGGTDNSGSSNNGGGTDNSGSSNTGGGTDNSGSSNSTNSNS